jgi:hypothetical protein
MKRIIGLLAVAAALAMGQNAAPDTTVKDVELTVYLLSGAGVGADDVPQDLASTVKQLHSLFSYKSYKLTESFILRGRSGPESQYARTAGVLPGSGLNYDFGYYRVRLSPQKPYMVHIDQLHINLTTDPGYGSDGKQRTRTVASIGTDLDLGDGQKTVVGKSSINNAGDALILVIVPKVIE